MTGVEVLAALAQGVRVPGPHLLVTAHADDETISAGGLMCALEDVTVLQLTDGAHAGIPEREARVSRRREERSAAFQAAGWRCPIIDGAAPDRGTLGHAERLLDLLRQLLQQIRPAVVWTHPYENGHLDHDTAAWLAQRAAQGPGGPLRMEFASYHATERAQAFGVFWPDPKQTTLLRPLGALDYQRKRAAMTAYWSQVDILRKFPAPEREAYRTAPTYDFSRPAPAGRNRWDIKGYQPTTAVWRARLAKLLAAEATA